MKINLKKTALYLVMSALFGFLMGACSTADATTPTQKSVVASQTQEVAPVQTPEAPKADTLNGTYTFEKDTLKFTATVEGDQIEVVMNIDDTTEGLYWVGTFPATAQDGQKIVSKADVEKLSASMLGSQDKTKQFVYKDGALTFKFTMMGITTNVKLEK